MGDSAMVYAHRRQSTSSPLSDGAYAMGQDHPSGWLTLDPMLLTMPKDLGEFVIVHELVHLLAPKHGKLFKLFMHAYLPDWEERERGLQEYAGDKGGFRSLQG